MQKCKSKSTNPGLTIGLVLHDLLESFNFLLWSGVEDAAKKADINTICFAGGEINSPYYRQVKRNVIYELIDKENVAGLVLAANILSSFIGADHFQEYCKRFHPLPITSIGLEMEGIPSVILGNISGMKGVITHLIETHGYKKIAFIRGPEANIESNLRFQAYKETLKDHNIPFDPSLTGIGNFRYDEGYEVMNRFLDSNAKIDAVVAASDLMILGAQEAIEKRGIKIPDEIAIAGFDDIEYGKHSLHPLTTVKYPIYHMARRATELLIQQINGEKVPLLVNVPAEVIIRRSCGCFSEEIKKAWIPAIKSPDKQFESVFTGHINSIIGEIQKTIGNREIIGLKKGWEKELLHSLFMELTQENKENIFITTLDTLLCNYYATGQDEVLWNNIFSVIRANILPYVKDKPDTRLKAENLFYQSSILIKDVTQNAQARSKFKTLRQSMDLMFASSAIIGSFDLPSLLNIMVAEMPKLGIKSCYISMYNNSTMISEESRLILAYNGYGRIYLDQDVRLFPSKQLFPRDLIKISGRFSLVIEALYTEEEQLGFILFGMDMEKGTINEALRDQISSALKGSMLMQQVIEKDKKLEEAHNALSLRAQQLEQAIGQIKENHEKLINLEKKASLGRLTAGIAHEMNTPLASVRAALKELGQLIDEYSQSLGNPQVSIEDHHEIVKDMQRSLNTAVKAAAKSAGFIRGMKAQTTDLTSAPLQAFPAATVILDTLNILEFALKRGNCILTTDLNERLLLYGNPRWLSEIITNLVINAIEACKPEGGNINIRMDLSDKNFLSLQVKDTGSGILPENIKKIYKPLFTTKPFGEGTGLGLSIINNLINDFKGSIDVKSKPGETIFTIRLPLAKEN